MKFVAWVFASALLLALSTRADEHDYKTGSETCDGWPRAPITMAAGFCAGIVVAPPQDAFGRRVLKFPRLLLAVGKDWLVTDLGNWGMKNGQVLRLTPAPGATQLKPLLTKLYNPHGLARGPDGNIYVGEMGRIFRFDPDAADPAATIVEVVSGLPDNRLHEDRHPLSYFIFDENGDLLVNVGAPSDQCEADGTLLPASCGETENTAGIRRYAYLGDGKWSADFIMFARGLRNSMALARHSSGTLLEAENSMDFPQADSPFDELNILKPGSNYGWPYCHDMTSATPAWSGAMDCASDAHEKPVRLLPPHSAPLGMLYYDGAMFPGLRGDLLMTWHGYRATGARIAAFRVDRRGIPVRDRHARYASYPDVPGGDVGFTPYPGPASTPLLLTPSWDKVPELRPMGAPVGLAVADDGAIWVTEDKNATILRIARDQP